MSNRRFEIQRLVRDTDQPLDRIGDDPKQFETLMVLLDAAHELLKHAEAIAECDDASFNARELALVRVMMGELDGHVISADDLRLAVAAIMHPPHPEGA